MAYSERYCDASASGSNLNGGFPIGGIYPVTATNGAFTQGGGAGGNDRFTAASGTPFSGCAVDDCVASYADGAAAPTGYVGVITAINGGGASIDLHLTRFSGTRPTTGASGRTAKVGGPWKGPNAASAFPFGFVTSVLTNTALDPVRVNLKDGTNYAITAAMTHANANIRFEGYTTTAGDGGLARIDGGSPATSYVMLLVSGNDCSLASIWFSGNGTNTTADDMVNLTGAHSYVFRCRFTNSARNGLGCSSGGALIEECEAHSCNTTDSSDRGGFRILEESTLIRCWSHDHTGGSVCGFVLGNSNLEPVVMIGCVSENNGGDGIATTLTTTSLVCIGCNFIGSADDGVDLRSLNATNAFVYFENCNFVNNTGWGINHDTLGITYPRFFNCGFFNNTLGKRTTGFFNASFIVGDIDYSSTPFTDAPNGNVGLNNTASAGALARGTGRGLFLQDSAVYSATTTSYPDVGAAQHQESAVSTQKSFTFG